MPPNKRKFVNLQGQTVDLDPENAEEKRSEIQQTESNVIAAKGSGATAEDKLIVERRNREAVRAQIQAQIESLRGSGQVAAGTTLNQVAPQQLAAASSQNVFPITPIPAQGTETIPQNSEQDLGISGFKQGGLLTKEGREEFAIGAASAVTAPDKALGRNVEIALSTPLGQGTARAGFEIVDAAFSTFSGRKGASVQTAENAYEDARKAMLSDIERVKRGEPGAADEARRNWQRMNSAIARLEGANKGLNMLNLRYWQGGGDEIAAETAIFKEDMVQYAQDIAEAEAEAKVAQQTRIAELQAQLSSIPIL